MAFFDQLGKKISQAGQTTIQKTKDVAEVAKINSMINDEENNINNAYNQIGKLYVTLHKDDCEEDFKAMVDAISESERKIADYQNQIKTIKGVVRCAKCGGEVSLSSAFCNSCGSPMPKQEAAPQTAAPQNYAPQAYAPQTANDIIVCVECGAQVKPGMKFCAACGTPVEQG
ncbi:MAG: zinc ribbon domain-containing protein [Acutalibacteraceae bacterium]|nr:zinc ribbon domain-containing protein [Acutalibacteraceae bacterium]